MSDPAGSDLKSFARTNSFDPQLTFGDVALDIWWWSLPFPDTVLGYQLREITETVLTQPKTHHTAHPYEITPRIFYQQTTTTRTDDM